MLNYILKRLLQLIPPLFGLTIILFVLLRIGGDPIYHLVDPEASAEEIEEVRIAYGFDKPLIVQYLNQLKMIFTGDFGNSFRFKTPAMPLVELCQIFGLVSCLYYCLVFFIKYFQYQGD